MSTDYASPSHVFDVTNNIFKTKTHETLTSHCTLDPFGKLGTYARINPDYINIHMYSYKHPIFEPDRTKPKGLKALEAFC